MKKIFVFAGQGSQFYGMGNILYKSNRTFRDTIDSLDSEISKLIGKSIKDIMFGKKNKRSDIFDSLSISSFAIFMFEYAAAKMMIYEAIEPDGVIGCSLGEFTAAVVSGVLDKKSAIQLLYKLLQLLEKELPYGGMISVYEDYFNICKTVGLKGCEVVSVNHGSNFVISGDTESIEYAEVELKRNKIAYLRLPIKYAFHSRYIDLVGEKYIELTKDMFFKTPRYEYYSCVTGSRIHKIDGEYLWRVMREPINWRGCVEGLEKDKQVFIDLSADAELASMLKYILPAYENVFQISSSFNTAIDITNVIKNIKKKGVRKLKAFVFPGQGSQVEGMGQDLFDEFSDLVKVADRILGYSIKDLCLNNPDGLLNRTDYTQPALYTVCALSYLKRMKDGESQPDYVAGHSIGEYAALFASGILDFETGLKLVMKRGELMVRAAGGKMAAVIGLKREQIAKVLEENGFTGIDIANLNSPTQIVISGLSDDITAAEKVFSKTDGCIMYRILNVSGAFHSRYMNIAKSEFTECLKTCKFNKMRIPVIANVTARPYSEENIVEILSKQLVSSVYWTDSVRYMMAKGVEDFVELGPGNVIQSLIKKIAREAEPMDLSSEESVVSPVVPEEEPLACAAMAQAESINESRIDPERISAMSLGSSEFRKDYNLKYAYVIGGMNRGISSEKMVVAAAKSGFLSFFGAEDLSYERIEEAIKTIQGALTNNEPYGFNMMFDLSRPDKEEAILNLYIKHGVHTIEASAFTTITKHLVKYRIKGIRKNQHGEIEVPNRIIAKLSRPEIAEGFMSPPPQRIVDVLLRDRQITEEEARLSQLIPMSYDICVEADSGGYTDQSNIFAILPAIQYLRNRICKKNGYSKKIRVGTAGGIGTPVAAAAVFTMGAEFILTGSINQCTVEASISDIAKDMMSNINVQDTGYIQPLDTYGANNKIQVLKKGTLFIVRASKLYLLYHEADSLEDIDETTREQLENRYFKKSFNDIFKEVEKQYESDVQQIAEAMKNPKLKMKMIFDWYIKESEKWAIEGNIDYQLDFKIMCGSALGAFNQWVKGTAFENWRNRKVAEIGENLMQSTAQYLREYMDMPSK